MAKGTGSGPNALHRKVEVRVERASRAPAEAVYALLADPRTHAVWGGERQGKQSRLLSVETTDDVATVGTEFATTGADPMGRFADRSVVTEAEPPRSFEFVTEARLTTKKGAVADWTNVHRYEITPTDDGCRIVYSLRISRISALPGMLAWFNVPVLGSIMTKAATSLPKRGLRNLADMAEERAGTRA
jgi:uncharacterized protein YndB with AHSA1/START domain